MSEGVMLTIVLTVAKFAAAIILAAWWGAFIRWRVVPSMQKATAFPVKKTALLVFITGAAIWLFQIEFAYRKPLDVPRQPEVEYESSEPMVVNPDAHETVEQRTQRLRDKANADGEKRKEDFSELDHTITPGGGGEK